MHAYPLRLDRAARGPILLLTASGNVGEPLALERLCRALHAAPITEPLIVDLRRIAGLHVDGVLALVDHVHWRAARSRVGLVLPANDLAASQRLAQLCAAAAIIGHHPDHVHRVLARGVTPVSTLLTSRSA